jgi:hypothetical protein
VGCQKIVVINCIISPKNCQSFMACDLHRREGIYPTPSGIRCRRVAQIMKDEICNPCFLAYPRKYLSNGFDALTVACGYLLDTLALRIKCDRQVSQHLG